MTAARKPCKFHNGLCDDEKAVKCGKVSRKVKVEKCNEACKGYTKAK